MLCTLVNVILSWQCLHESIGPYSCVADFKHPSQLSLSLPQKMRFGRGRAVEWPITSSATVLVAVMAICIMAVYNQWVLYRYDNHEAKLIDGILDRLEEKVPAHIARFKEKLIRLEERFARYQEKLAGVERKLAKFDAHLEEKLVCQEEKLTRQVREIASSC